MRKNTPRKTGFTLLELLIVVTIISLLLSIMVPSFNNTTKDLDVVAAQAALHSWRIKIDEHHTLHGEWPKELDEGWFLGRKFPRNPWLMSKDAKSGKSFNSNPYANPVLFHPKLKSIEQFNIPFWYNPTNGEIRIRVPREKRNDETLDLYNYVNGTDTDIFSGH